MNLMVHVLNVTSIDLRAREAWL